MGIYCMTTRPDNVLMWSHYAAAHSGFCLQFTTEDSFFRNVREAPLLPVRYSTDRLYLNLIERNDYYKEISHALTTKAKDWRYEDEWRAVDFTHGPGIHMYPAEALTGVILGCRITPANRQRIMQWCQRCMPRPTVYWAEEKDREFGLDIKPIPWIA